MDVEKAKKIVRAKYPHADIYEFSPAVWSSDAYYDTVWVEDGFDNKLSEHRFHADTAWVEAAERILEGSE